MKKSTLEAESGTEAAAGVRVLSRADVPVKATGCYFQKRFIEMSKVFIYLVLVVSAAMLGAH